MVVSQQRSYSHQSSSKTWTGLQNREKVVRQTAHGKQMLYMRLKIITLCHEEWR
jgi:hypothetical protein